MEMNGNYVYRFTVCGGYPQDSVYTWLSRGGQVALPCSFGSLQATRYCMLTHQNVFIQLFRNSNSVLNNEKAGSSIFIAKSKSIGSSSIMLSALNLADSSASTGGVGVGGASAPLLITTLRCSLHLWLVLLWLTCQDLRIAQSNGG